MIHPAIPRVEIPRCQTPLFWVGNSVHRDANDQPKNADRSKAQCTFLNTIKDAAMRIRDRKAMVGLLHAGTVEV